MKNPLREVFINDLMMLGEKATAPTKHNPGDVWPTKGGFGAMNPSRNIDYFKDKKDADAFAKGRVVGKGAEQPNKKKKKPADKIGSTGVDADLEKKKQQVSASLRGIRPSILPISPKSEKAGLGTVHTEFFGLLERGNVKALEKFMETHGIVFDERKNTFYVYSIKGREEKKIFGDGSKSEKGGRQQKELFDRLIEMGVDVKLRDTYTDPLKPQGIVPKDQQRKFDGRREGDAIIFNKQRYELIPEGKFKDYITQQTQSWIRAFEQKNGRKPTGKERDEASRQFVILANAMNDRYRILEKLMQRSNKNKEPHTIALFEGQEGAKQYINNVRQSLLQRIPDGDTKLREDVETRLRAVEDAEGDDESIKALVEFYRLIETSDVFVSSASSFAESLSIMLELKRGRQVIVPMSDNFKAADLVTLSTDEDVDTTTLSLEELANRVKVVYSSISAKREEGAASSMIAKFRMSVFAPHHKETLEQLEKLSSGHANLFSEDKDIRTEKENAVKKIVMSSDNIDIIKKYFNLPPKTTFNDLLKILGTGGVICVGGKTVARPIPDYMQRDGVDEQAYRYTYVAQLCAEAIANTKVIAQGFSNHFWGGKAGFVEVDGINSQVKQVTEPNKDQRLRKPPKSKTPTKMPDYLVSHNVIPGPNEPLRSGNPC